MSGRRVADAATRQKMRDSVHSVPVEDAAAMSKKLSEKQHDEDHGDDAGDASNDAAARRRAGVAKEAVDDTEFQRAHPRDADVEDVEGGQRQLIAQGLEGWLEKQQPQPPYLWQRRYFRVVPRPISTATSAAAVATTTASTPSAPSNAPAQQSIDSGRASAMYAGGAAAPMSTSSGLGCGSGSGDATLHVFVARARGSSLAACGRGGGAQLLLMLPPHLVANALDDGSAPVGPGAGPGAGTSMGVSPTPAGAGAAAIPFRIQTQVASVCDSDDDGDEKPSALWNERFEVRVWADRFRRVAASSRSNRGASPPVTPPVSPPVTPPAPPAGGRRGQLDDQQAGNQSDRDAESGVGEPRLETLETLETMGKRDPSYSRHASLSSVSSAEADGDGEGVRIVLHGHLRSMGGMMSDGWGAHTSYLGEASVPLDSVQEFGSRSPSTQSAVEAKAGPIGSSTPTRQNPPDSSIDRPLGTGTDTGESIQSGDGASGRVMISGEHARWVPLDVSGSVTATAAAAAAATASAVVVAADGTDGTLQPSSIQQSPARSVGESDDGVTAMTAGTTTAGMTHEQAAGIAATFGGGSKSEGGPPPEAAEPDGSPSLTSAPLPPPPSGRAAPCGPAGDAGVEIRVAMSLVSDDHDARCGGSGRGGGWAGFQLEWHKSGYVSTANKASNSIPLHRGCLAVRVESASELLSVVHAARRSGREQLLLGGSPDSPGSPGSRGGGSPGGGRSGAGGDDNDGGRHVMRTAEAAEHPLCLPRVTATIPFASLSLAPAVAGDTTASGEGGKSDDEGDGSDGRDGLVDVRGRSAGETPRAKGCAGGSGVVEIRDGVGGHGDEPAARGKDGKEGKAKESKDGAWDGARTTIDRDGGRPAQSSHSSSSLGRGLVSSGLGLGSLATSSLGLGARIAGAAAGAASNNVFELVPLPGGRRLRLRAPSVDAMLHWLNGLEVRRAVDNPTIREFDHSMFESDPLSPSCSCSHTRRGKTDTKGQLAIGLTAADPHDAIFATLVSNGRGLLALLQCSDWLVHSRRHPHEPHRSRRQMEQRRRRHRPTCRESRTGPMAIRYIRYERPVHI